MSSNGDVHIAESSPLVFDDTLYKHQTQTKSQMGEFKIFLLLLLINLSFLSHSPYFPTPTNDESFCK